MTLQWMRVDDNYLLLQSTNESTTFVYGGYQAVLVAARLRVLLLCGSPAFQQLPHGPDYRVVRALSLQDEHCVRHVHKAHAQLMRCPNTRQSRSLEHAPEAARHVQIIAIRHAASLNCANVHPLCSSPTHPVRSICAGSSATRLLRHPCVAQQICLSDSGTECSRRV